MSKWLGELIFYLHIPIFVFWVVPFFIPLSLWSNRVEVHFYYIVVLYVVQYATGLLYLKKTKRWVSLCPVTLVMQKLRGHDWFEKENYEHGFVAELWGCMGIPSSKKQVGTLQHVTLAIVCMQYFLGWLVF